MFEQPLILAIDSGGSKSDFILLTPDGQETARSRGKGVAALHVGIEVHPKSWTQPLRCIFYEERTQNKPSV